jgi:hypothetical protein
MVLLLRCNLTRSDIVPAFSTRARAGSWRLDENLAQALGRQLAELVASVPTSVPAEIWATALALAALDLQFADEKEVCAPSSPLFPWRLTRVAPTTSSSSGVGIVGWQGQEVALARAQECHRSGNRRIHPR